MDNVEFQVPTSLQEPFFFPDGRMMWSKEDEERWNVKNLFIYEGAFYENISGKKPWEKRDETIPLIKEEWAKLEEILDQCFQKKNRKKALPFMKVGIGLFIQFLHWANKKPVVLKPQINFDELTIKPVNVEERLDFISIRPNGHHAFIQLRELMNELDKAYNKAKIMESRRK